MIYLHLCSIEFAKLPTNESKTHFMIIIQSYLWEEVNGMNKTDLINAVAEASSLSKRTQQSVDAVFDSILEALKQGDKVQLIGFGNFEVRERAARKGRNPQTGEEIEIAASKVPAFKPGKALKDAVK